MPKILPPYWLTASAKTRERMAMSLTRMLREGPEVSLSGSPTVSPMTAACSREGEGEAGGEVINGRQ